MQVVIDMLDCPYSYLRFFNSTMRLQARPSPALPLLFIFIFASLVPRRRTSSPPCSCEQPQTVMDNCSELCNALNKIITSTNGKSRQALPSTPRPPTVQTADLLGFDVEGTV